MPQKTHKALNINVLNYALIENYIKDTYNYSAVRL